MAQTESHMHKGPEWGKLVLGAAVVTGVALAAPVLISSVMGASTPGFIAAASTSITTTAAGIWTSFTSFMGTAFGATTTTAATAGAVGYMAYQGTDHISEVATDMIKTEEIRKHQDTMEHATGYASGYWQQYVQHQREAAEVQETAKVLVQEEKQEQGFRGRINAERAAVTNQERNV